MELAASNDPVAHPVVEYGARRLVIVGAVMLAALLETLDSTIVNVALPTIEGNLGVAVDAGVWIVTGYIIANVVSIPLNPLLIRTFGRRAYFTTCIAGFTAASVLCSTAHSLELLVAFRFLQGAFGGGLIATSQGVMRDTFPPAAIGTSSALFSIALIAGPALGPLAGGYLTDNLSWEWIFLVNFVPGTIAAIVVGIMLRDPLPRMRTTVDWPGVALLAAGFGTMQYVLDNGERQDWFDDHAILAATIASLVALGLFARRQWTNAHPVVDLHVFRLRSVAVGCVLALAFGAIIFAPAIVTPLYASSILQYTAWDSGLLLVMRALPVVLLTPVFATLAQRGADVRYMLVTGFLVSAGAMLWLNVEMTSTSSFWSLAWPLVVSGVGQSMLLVPLIVGVLTTTPPGLNGKIAPLITLCVQLGGSVGSATSIAFFDRRTSFHADVFAASSTTAHLGALGMAQPTAAFLSRLAGIVSQQATTMGLADTLVAVGLLAACAAPFVLLFPRSRSMV
jgi:DHA2 family multidrug resistance protein